MDLRAATRPASWAGLRVEARARLRPVARPQLPLTWQLPAEIRRRASVQWPVTYDWVHAGQWLDSIREGLATHVEVRNVEIEQPFERVLIAVLILDGKSHRIAIDYADSTELSTAAADDVALYFKMQHLSAGYDRANVVPGGFVPSFSRLYDYLRLVRRTRDRQTAGLDVFGAFSPGYASAVRAKAIEALSTQPHFKFGGGWAVTRYSGYLDRVARSKVCIDLPGNGPFCFRLVDYLAVGACIVGPPHSTRLHVPLVDGEHITYTDPSLADLVDVAAELVDDQSRRERLGSNARLFFDRYLDARQLAAYYLSSALAATS